MIRDDSYMSVGDNLDTYAFDEIEVDKQHSNPAHVHDIGRNMYALSITWEFIGIL